ncbi:radical SAM protein [Candidatus Uhrbacteria bacterium]|nr:radical SAM protein [Candidatus Uhrbacteria bacterium]
MKNELLGKDVWALSDGEDVVLYNPICRRWYFTDLTGLELYRIKLSDRGYEGEYDDVLTREEIDDFIGDVDIVLNQPLERVPIRRGSTINITNGCNLRCLHCRPDSHIGAANLRTATIDQFLSNERRLGSGSLTVTGGEPLLVWKSTKHALGTAQKMGMDLGLLTNGTLVTGEIADFLAKNGVRVQVSLDSVDPVTFRRMRGCDVQRVIDGIRMLKRKGIYVSVSYSLCRLTHESANDVIFFCLEEKIDSFHIAMMEKGGRADNNWNMLYLGDEEIIAFHDRLLDRYFSGLREKLPIDDYEMMMGQVMRPPSTSHCNCMCGVAALHEDGEVYGCTNLCGQERFSLGKVSDAEALLSTQRQKYATLPTVDDIAGCRDCTMRWLCLGGCRDRVMLSHGGEICHPDPNCRVLKWLFERMLIETARVVEKE